MDDYFKTTLLACQALLLGRDCFVIDLRSRTRSERKELTELDRADYSDFKLFRATMDGDGLYHELHEPRFQLGENLGERTERVKALIVSNEDIARIALRDIHLSEDELRALEAAHGRKMSWREMAAPLCRWGPGEVVWTLRKLLPARFESMYAMQVTMDCRSAVTDAAAPAPRKEVVLHKRRNKATKLIKDICARYEGTGRMPSAQVLQTLVAELFDLKPNAAKTAWRSAKEARWDFRNKKKSELVDIDELRCLDIIQRVKSDPPDIH